MKPVTPPTRFDIGSAAKIPLMTGFHIMGRKIVSGTTIIIFLKREKKIACFGLSRAVKTD